MQWRKVLMSGLFALTMLQAGAASAEYKIAFVEGLRLLRESPQAKEVEAKLQKEFSRRDEDLVAQQNQINTLQEKLQRDGAIMSEEEAKRLERDILSRQRKLRTAHNEFKEDLTLRRNELLGKLQKAIGEVIVQMAKEEKFDLVLESGVVYASDRANITDKVLERLRKQQKQP